MENKIKKIIYSISDILRGAFPYEEFNSICIYFVFIKYILDNKKLLLNEDTFANILALQRMFDRKELNEQLLIDVSIAIEKEFDLPQNSLVNFAQTYIRFTNIKKSKNVSYEVLKELSEISFENMGKEIVEVLKDTLYLSATSFGKIMSDKISNPYISKIISELLEIKDGDSYADLAYGMGISTLEITNGKDCSITGYEVNCSSVVIAKMLLIMSGVKDFKLNNCDILECNIAYESFNKISTMPPLGYKIRENQNNVQIILEKFNLPNKLINFEDYVLLQSILSLKNNGTAVITVSPNLLFSSTIINSKIRKILTKNHLQTVIQLPALYYGTIVPTVIIVIKKQRATNRIMFIDASNNNYFNFYDKSDKKNIVFLDDGIEKIKEICLNQENINGISYCATIDEISASEYILTPAKYIKIKNSRKIVSNEEIDLRLKKLYEEVRKFMED